MATRKILKASAAKLVSGAAGVFIWTLCEYVLHRNVMHNGAIGRPAMAEHRMHHRYPDLTQPRRRAMLYAGVGAGVRLAMFLPIGRALLVGWAGGFVVYEQIHWAYHHRPPRTGLGAELRRRHFAHHYLDANQDFGVTNSVWDSAFGTKSASSEPVLVVSQRLPGWAVDEDHALVEGFGDVFALKPSVSRP